MKIWFDGLHYLDIPKARPSDSGIYKVVGRNKFGMISHETRLHVFRKNDPGVQLRVTGRGKYFLFWQKGENDFN